MTFMFLLALKTLAPTVLSVLHQLSGLRPRFRTTSLEVLIPRARQHGTRQREPVSDEKFVLSGPTSGGLQCRLAQGLKAERLDSSMHDSLKQDRCAGQCLTGHPNTSQDTTKQVWLGKWRRAEADIPLQVPDSGCLPASPQTEASGIGTYFKLLLNWHPWGKIVCS